MNPAEFPEWSFDGSSTGQADGNKSDCILRPVFVVRARGQSALHGGAGRRLPGRTAEWQAAVLECSALCWHAAPFTQQCLATRLTDRPRASPLQCPDPIRGGDNVLVMCDVLDSDHVPHITNTRAKVGAGWGLLSGRSRAGRAPLTLHARQPSLPGASLCQHADQQRLPCSQQHAHCCLNDFSLPAPPPPRPPQLEAIINDKVKEEAPLFGFEQEYTMLAKGGHIYGARPGMGRQRGRLGGDDRMLLACLPACT